MTGPISRVPSDRSKETSEEAEKFFGREVLVVVGGWSGRGRRGEEGRRRRVKGKNGIVLVRMRLMGVMKVRSGRPGKR